MPKVLRPHIGSDNVLVLDGEEATGSPERIAQLQALGLVEIPDAEPEPNPDPVRTDAPKRRGRAK